MKARNNLPGAMHNCLGFLMRERSQEEEDTCPRVVLHSFIYSTDIYQIFLKQILHTRQGNKNKHALVKTENELINKYIKNERI